MKKIADFFQLFLKSYVAFFFVMLIAPLIIKLIEDLKDPLSLKFYIVLSFGLPLIVTIVMIIYYLHCTKHRKHDPYRFSSNQFRFFKVPNVSRTDLIQLLEKLGYTCQQGILERDQIEIHANRKLAQLPKKFLREGANIKDPRPEQTLIVKGTYEGDGSRVSVKCCTTEKFIIGDYSQTTYFSLEELIDALGWEKYLTDAEGHAINRNWERLSGSNG